MQTWWIPHPDEFFRIYRSFNDGSGLTEILDTIYAENTTPHLLSGKAISRAVRGFVIIESALHVLLHREQLSMEKDSEVTYST